MLFLGSNFPADAKEVAANPPEGSFLGCPLQFFSRPDESGDLEQHSSSEQDHTSKWNHSSEQFSSSKQDVGPTVDDSSDLHKLSTVKSSPDLPVLETPHRIKQRSMSDAAVEPFSITGSPLFSPPIGMSCN